MCFKSLQSILFHAHVTAVKHFLVYVTEKCCCREVRLACSLDVLWSPRPQAARAVHQWQLLGETTAEPGPFGGPNNNVNGRAEGQEVQPDMPVLRKALFSEGGLLGKKQWQGLFQPEILPWLTSRWQPSAITWCFCSEIETVSTIMMENAWKIAANPG